jgi:hypothetical protein
MSLFAVSIAHLPAKLGWFLDSKDFANLISFSANVYTMALPCLSLNPMGAELNAVIEDAPHSDGTRHKPSTG